MSRGRVSLTRHKAIVFLTSPTLSNKTWKSCYKHDRRYKHPTKPPYYTPLNTHRQLTMQPLSQSPNDSQEFHCSQFIYQV